MKKTTKVIYFFTAILVMFFLTNCKVLPQNEEEYYNEKEAELLSFEMDLNEDLER